MINKIKKFEKLIKENKMVMLQIIVLYNMYCHNNYHMLTDKQKEKLLVIIYNLYLDDETKTDLGAFSDCVLDNYKQVLNGEISKNDIYNLI